MARGWESKAVEAQQDAAAEVELRGPALTARDAEVARTRATLMLARTHAQGQLQRASVAAHKTMLERAIADIDRQLEALPNANR